MISIAGLIGLILVIILIFFAIRGIIRFFAKKN